MINRKTYHRTLIFIALFGLSYSCNQSEQKDAVSGTHKLEIAPIRVDSGWGYNILVDDKVYIHQYCIPAIGGNKVFFTKEDAVKTGKVVVQKMMKGMIPSITRHDLDSLKVAY
ncbi:MAG TPA: DUF4907 domain-containing protein [Chitinophagaceae bacterium]|nr:DUF4907 domain-containing protein [Chitinophagaceae bacterium]